MDRSAELAQMERAHSELRTKTHRFISQNVFMKSFCKMRFAHKFVNLFYIGNILNWLTELCGN